MTVTIRHHSLNSTILIFSLIVWVQIFQVAECAGQQQAPLCPCACTNTPTPFPTPSVTPSNTPTSSLTPTPTPSTTSSAGLSPTSTPSNSPTPTRTPTASITPSTTPSTIVVVAVEPPFFGDIDVSTRYLESSFSVFQDAPQGQEIVPSGGISVTDTAGGDKSTFHVVNIECLPVINIPPGTFPPCADPNNDLIVDHNIEQFPGTKILLLNIGLSWNGKQPFALPAKLVIDSKPLYPVYYNITVQGSTGLLSSAVARIDVQPLMIPSASTTPTASISPGASTTSTATVSPTISTTPTAGASMTPTPSMSSFPLPYLRLTKQNIEARIPVTSNSLTRNITVDVLHAPQIKWDVLRSRSNRQKWVKRVMVEAYDNSRSSITIEIDATNRDVGTYSQILVISPRTGVYVSSDGRVIPGGYRGENVQEQSLTVSLICQAPVMSLSASQITQNVPPDSTSNATLTIENAGDALLQWYIRGDPSDPTLSGSLPSWLHISGSDSGLTFPGESTDVIFELDASSDYLSEGSFLRSTIMIYTNQANSPEVPVQVTMRVAYLSVCPPELHKKLTPDDSQVIYLELINIVDFDVGIAIEQSDSSAYWLKTQTTVPSEISVETKSIGFWIQLSHIADKDGHVLSPGNYTTSFDIVTWMKTSDPVFSSLTRRLRQPVFVTLETIIGPPFGEHSITQFTGDVVDGKVYANADVPATIHVTLRDSFGFGPTSQLAVPTVHMVSLAENAGLADTQMSVVGSGTFAIEIISLRIGRILIDVSVDFIPVGGGIGSPIELEILPAVCDPFAEIISANQLSCLCAAGFEHTTVTVNRTRNDSLIITEDDMPTTYVEEIEVQRCVACGSGKIKALPGNSESCQTCPEGEFAILDDEGRQTKCEKCPSSGASCDSGVLFFMSGYWCEQCMQADTSPTVQSRMLPLSTEAYSTSYERLLSSGPNLIDQSSILVECSPTSACRTRNDSSVIVCADGHTGPMCGVCEDGWARNTPTSLCAPCMNKSLAWLITSAIVALDVLMICFVALKDNEETTTEMIASSILRLTSNYFQVNNVIQGLQIATDTPMTSFFEFSSEVSQGVPLSTSPVQCSIGWDFYTRLYFVLSLPILAAVVPIVVGIFYYAFSLIRLSVEELNSKNKSLEDGKQNMETSALVKNDETEMHTNPISRRSTGHPNLRLRTDRSNSTSSSEEMSETSKEAKLAAIQARIFRTVLRAAVVIMFLQYFAVTSTALSTLDLTKNEFYGKRYISSDLSKSTADSEYSGARGLSVAALLVYTVGIPVLGAVILLRNRHHLIDPEVSSKWSFLYSGLRLDIDSFEASEVKRHAIGNNAMATMTKSQRTLAISTNRWSIFKSLNVAHYTYLWEVVVVTFRKVAVAVIAVLVVEPHAQAALVLMVLTISLVLQALVKPYSLSLLNNLELLGLSALWGLCLTQIVLSEQTLFSSTFVTFVDIVQILLNGVALFCFFVFAVMSVSQKIREQIQNFRLKWGHKIRCIAIKNANGVVSPTGSVTPTPTPTPTPTSKGRWSPYERTAKVAAETETTVATDSTIRKTVSPHYKKIPDSSAEQWKLLLDTLQSLAEAKRAGKLRFGAKALQDAVSQIKKHGMEASIDVLLPPLAKLLQETNKNHPTLRDPTFSTPRSTAPLTPAWSEKSFDHPKMVSGTDRDVSFLASGEPIAASKFDGRHLRNANYSQNAVAMEVEEATRSRQSSSAGTVISNRGSYADDQQDILLPNVLQDDCTASSPAPNQLIRTHTAAEASMQTPANSPSSLSRVKSGPALSHASSASRAESSIKAVEGNDRQSSLDSVNDAENKFELPDRDRAD